MNEASACKQDGDALPEKEDKSGECAGAKTSRISGLYARPWFLHLVFGGLIFLIAFGTAVYYLLTVEYKPHFGSNWFAPSVMIVEGFGMVNPNLSRTPKLAGFLAGKSPAWDPEGERETLTGGTLHWFQRDHPNLIYSVALCWRLFGYSWKALIPLHALMFALSVMLAFGVCLLVMPRPIAFLAALLFMLSPAHVQMIPDLRDYSKAPFILAMILACGYLAREPRTVHRVLAAAAAIGAWVGLGLGFRLDMTICILPPLVTLLFFLGGTWKRRLVLGPLAAVVFAAALFITGKPSIGIMRTHGTMASHNIGGGLYWRFDEDMGLRPSYYRMLYRFNDHYIFETSSSFYRRTHDPKAEVPWFQPQYFDAGEKYLRTYAALFPSDVLLRACGALLRTVESSPATIQEEYKSNRFLDHCAKRLAWPMKLACDYGRYFAFAAILLLTAHRFSWGLFALGALLYLGGYPSLQFMPRHCFHLSLIPWWCLGFLISQFLILVWMLVKPSGRSQLKNALTSPRWFNPPIRALAFAALTVLCVSIPIHVARTYQEGAVREYVGALVQAEREPVPVREEMLNKENQAFLHCDALFENLSADAVKAGAAAAYLVAEFAGPPQKVELGLRYDAVSAFKNFSFTMPVHVEGKGIDSTTRVFFPVYERMQPASIRGHFLGVTIPQSQRRLLRGIYRVKNADSFPLWPTLFLSPQWREEPPRLTLPWAPSPYPPLLNQALQIKNQPASR